MDTAGLREPRLSNGWLAFGGLSRHGNACGDAARYPASERQNAALAGSAGA